MKKLGPPEQLQVCYEAGPTGYALYWQLAETGIACQVVAPGLVPTKAADRVKTDRRDAERLVRSFRAGELTAVWVPDAAHEALRDLLRAREAAKEDQLRARHRLAKMLLRHGQRAPEGVKAWTGRWESWAKGVVFDEPARQGALEDYRSEVEHARHRIARLEQAIEEAIQKAPAAMREVIAALQCLRGVKTISAATIVAETGKLSRFRGPRQLMSYSGLVPREHSSGGRRRQGAITKTGNAHLRRILGEAAWAYRHKPAVGLALRQRQKGQRAEILELADKAQHRLHRRYWHLLSRGKNHLQAVTAVARELLGFVWAIAVAVETAQAQRIGHPQAA
jgi:transposase